MNKVDKIISILENRGGFDDWWNNIDFDLQDEIKLEIENVINEPAETNYNLAE